MFHYLDNAATTPVRPEAAQAALEAMTEGWGGLLDTSPSPRDLSPSRMPWSG